jgi:hypothetical protein
MRGSSRLSLRRHVRRPAQFEWSSTRTLERRRLLGEMTSRIAYDADCRPGGGRFLRLAPPVRGFFHKGSLRPEVVSMDADESRSLARLPESLVTGRQSSILLTAPLMRGYLFAALHHPGRQRDQRRNDEHY